MKKLAILMLLLAGCKAYQKVLQVSARKTLLDQITFATGSIDIDLRGKNVYQRSFLGILFNASDTLHYETVYFRPFNFGVTLRRNHAVQYMCLPDYPWSRLRAEQPLRFEQPVRPVPVADQWFHATIRITRDSVRVWVNHAAEPSLSVKRLTGPIGNRFGLFVDGLPAEFRSLRITRD